MFLSQASITSLKSAVDLLISMPPEVRLLFSQVERLVRRLLVVPCSSASNERAFSELRRLKSWLRTTMSQTRLNHLAVLQVHQDMLDELSLTVIVEEFVCRNDYRRNIFGRV
jgi:hypothetical protein